MLTISISGVGETTLRLHRYAEHFPRHLIRRLTHDVHEAAVKKAAVHTRTGTMEHNIAMRIRGTRGEVYIEDDGMMVSWRGRPVNYSLFVHFGSRPHPIYPRRKKALRWSQGDIFRFAKKVDHPGYRGDPFMYNAAREVFDRLNQIAEEVHHATI